MVVFTLGFMLLRFAHPDIAFGSGLDGSGDGVP